MTRGYTQKLHWDHSAWLSPEAKRTGNNRDLKERGSGTIYSKVLDPKRLALPRSFQPVSGRLSMRIVAFVKTATGAAIDAADALSRAGRIGPGTLGAIDARSVEAAIRLREALGGEVVAAAIAPPDVMGAVREAIAIGADRGILLSDPRIDATDIVGRGRVAAALLSHLAADVGMARSCGPQRAPYSAGPSSHRRGRCRSRMARSWLADRFRVATCGSRPRPHALLR
jgi:hypothetical protein